MVRELDQRYRRPRRAWRAFLPRDWVFPLALALFVGIFVWFGRSIHDFLLPSSSAVLVPSLVGQTLADANGEAARLKLHPQVVARQVSDRYPKDVIINQQPAPGARVREGRQISLIVSNGVQIYSMPDVRYQSLREAGLDISHARLQIVKTKYVPNDEVPPNHVIDQEPAPLTSVREGSAVSLTISKGGAAVIRVPNFVGHDITQARAEATREKVHLGQIVWTPLGPGGPAHGQVVRQTPAAGQQIDPFDVVSLQVSAGPHESGYIVRQVHVTASVPGTLGNDQPQRVRVTVTDATGQWNLFDAYAQPAQKLDFTVTAVGTSLVDMFINNSLVSETRLGVEPPAVYNEKRKDEINKESGKF